MAVFSASTGFGGLSKPPVSASRAFPSGYRVWRMLGRDAGAWLPYSLILQSCAASDMMANPIQTSRANGGFDVGFRRCGSPPHGGQRETVTPRAWGEFDSIQSRRRKGRDLIEAGCRDAPSEAAGSASGPDPHSVFFCGATVRK